MEERGDVAIRDARVFVHTGHVASQRSNPFTSFLSMTVVLSLKEPGTHVSFHNGVTRSIPSHTSPETYRASDGGY
ncbi:MAG: hypothetical protein QOK44_1741 [Betaproteobacteria bacterium]|nr:hypothetical protein [Betaproteobacteria bacterium]